MTRSLARHSGASRAAPTRSRGAAVAPNVRAALDGRNAIGLGDLQAQIRVPLRSKPGKARPPMRADAASTALYSAGAVTTDAPTVTGSARRRKRRQAILMSRKSLTQALGLAKCEANSRSVSKGSQ
jgi:hypothetical protein